MIMLKSAFMSILLLTASPLLTTPPKIQEKPTVTLYYNPNCFYCKKVLNYIKEEGENVPLKNTQDAEVRNELVSIGRKKTNSFFFIHS